MARRARRERIEDGIRVVVNREHENLWKFHHFGELAHTFYAIHARQADVHEHDLRFELRDFTQRLFAAGKGADALTVRRTLQDVDHARAHRGIVFNNGDFYGHIFELNCWRLGRRNAIGWAMANSADSPIFFHHLMLADSLTPR